MVVMITVQHVGSSSSSSSSYPPLAFSLLLMCVSVYNVIIYFIGEFLFT